MKTVFLDIDGVMYKDAFFNQKVLDTIKNKNHKYVFCTGRGYLRLLDVVKQNLSVNDFAIIENGSKIVYGSGEIISYKILSKKDKNFINLISYTDVNFILYNSLDSNNYKVFSNDNLINIKHIDKKFDSYYDFCQEMLKDKQTQVTILFKNKRKKLYFLNECLKQQINAVMSDDYVVINAVDTNKKYGILQYCKIFKTSLKDFIIVGNDYNDLSMYELPVFKKIFVKDNNDFNGLLDSSIEQTNFNDLSITIEKFL